MTINPYEPEMAKIKKVVDENPEIKTFVLDKKMHFLPGQFVQVSLPGFGEAPISISSYPDLELTFRPVGSVTDDLYKMRPRNKIGIRGPYGNPYPFDYLKGKDILLISGGCGLAPIRSFIDYYLLNKKHFSSLVLFYGARNPKSIIYKNELEKWKKHFSVHVTVDEADKNWKGNIGVVTKLLGNFKLPKNPVAMICGPPIMFKFVSHMLNAKGVSDDKIIVSFERNMRCGIGKCFHCNIGSKLVCKDGPNFRWSEVKGLE